MDIREQTLVKQVISELANLEIPGRMQPGFLQLETMTFEAQKPV
jgi:hypothetical protein